LAVSAVSMGSTVIKNKLEIYSLKPSAKGAKGSMYTCKLSTINRLLKTLLTKNSLNHNNNMIDYCNFKHKEV